MKLTSIPPIPESLRYDLTAEAKFEELASLLIGLDKLSLANVSTLEVAASTYSAWQEAKDYTSKHGHEAPSSTHVHRHRTAYFVALGALGLAKTPKDGKTKASAPKPSKPAPIKIPSAKPTEAKKPRLRIYGIG